MTKVKMIDPPSGWRYGFPKAIPEDVKDVREWLVEQGYPREVMLKYGEYFHCRYWTKEIDKTDHVPEVRKEVSDHFVDVNKMIEKSEKPIIPEISDDEIDDVAWEKFITESGRFEFISGAKWYREQLKKINE